MAIKRTWQHHLDVVGLQFRWKRDGRRALSDMVRKASITGIRLIREPDNKFDPNAIMVLLPTRLMKGRQLGYLRADTASLLAPRLDKGILEVSRAILLSLEGDDYSIGELLVHFKDIAKPVSKRKKAVAKKSLDK